jgi:hypothetical protein
MSSDAKARLQYIATHWGHPGRRGHVELACGDPRDGTLVCMGELVAVVYRTLKAGDGGVQDYEHTFKKTRPLLCFTQRDKRLIIAGGAYTVQTRGIVG